MPRGAGIQSAACAVGPGGARRDDGDGGAPVEVEGGRRRTQQATAMGMWVRSQAPLAPEAALQDTRGPYCTLRSIAEVPTRGPVACGWTAGNRRRGGRARGAAGPNARVANKTYMSEPTRAHGDPPQRMPNVVHTSSRPQLVRASTWTEPVPGQTLCTSVGIGVRV